MDGPTDGQMNGFYGKQYSDEDLQRFAQTQNQQGMMGLDMTGMQDLTAANMGNADFAGQAMNDFVAHDNSHIQRRQTYVPQYGTPVSSPIDQRRPASMMEFGGVPNRFTDYQFDMPNNGIPHALANNGGIAQRRVNSRGAPRRMSGEADMRVNTNFGNQPSRMNSVGQSPAFTPAMPHADVMDTSLSGDFTPRDLSMAMSYQGLADLSNMSGSMEMYSQPNMYPMVSSSMDNGSNGLPMQGQAMQPVPPPSFQQQPSAEPGDSMNNNQAGTMSRHSTAQNQAASAAPDPSHAASIENMVPMMQNMANLRHDAGAPPHSATNGSSQRDNRPPSHSNFTSGPPMRGATSDQLCGPGGEQLPRYLDVYSSSGFDMLGILMRVATRRNPQINIGAVDMSCAFVVCDVTQHDLPIVYCSEVFERLTGYTKHEILGQNCRFLQAPDGRVQSGMKRKYVDDDAVYHVKAMILARREAQISLINYRKGGQPFMNLLTMIPVAYDTEEIRYYVGFQVDLVEQPTSITNKNPDGTYSINYQRGSLPSYHIPHKEGDGRRDPELGQTIGRDEVSTVLSTIGSGESELSRRIWDKVLLENTDDVIHVLSLKGLFLYLSPSCRKVLEYEPHELVGTALSSVCHPSDIVPVTRELKETSNGSTVNVVFRIRRKIGGYTWFESHGSLHTEPGKGKKCIILVGRERPVFAVAKTDISSNGSFGESELWAKMSTSGMFLFVSSSSKSLLDRHPEDLVGTSFQSLMRPESKTELGKMLELSRTGRRATFKHDIQNRRGQTLHAQTTIHPGDATEGQKPTFLISQTRLPKMSRGAAPALSKETSISSAGTAGSDPSAESGANNRPSTPHSFAPIANGEGIRTQAGGHALAIGKQHEALAAAENIFDELKTTRSTSWQFELRQMEKRNRLLAEELQTLVSNKKKRKRRKGMGQLQKDCANCHTRSTPEWRRGPSGFRDLCNSCGLRWAKQQGRTSPRTGSVQSDSKSKKSNSPLHNAAPNPGDKRLSSTAREASVSDQNEHKAPKLEMNSPRGYAGTNLAEKMDLADERSETPIQTVV